MKEETLLGKKVEYPNKYSPEILFKVPRKQGREMLGGYEDFYGFDIWNIYEISWLNLKGKPEIRILELYINSSSEYLVESKSLKLYFASFHNERFDSEDSFLKLVEKDLANLLGAEIFIKLKKIEDFIDEKLHSPIGISLDNLEIELENYEPNAGILKSYKGEHVQEELYSNLLKTNCLITLQPDWATISVKYKGPRINRESLLKYIISFRNENMFHEYLVEKIFKDILDKCSPEELTIYARYTRRGGIDINPIRSTHEITNIFDLNNRLARQ